MDTAVSLVSRSNLVNRSSAIVLSTHLILFLLTLFLRAYKIDVTSRHTVERHLSFERFLLATIIIVRISLYLAETSSVPLDVIPKHMHLFRL